MTRVHLIVCQFLRYRTVEAVLYKTLLLAKSGDQLASVGQTPSQTLVFTASDNKSCPT